MKKICSSGNKYLRSMLRLLVTVNIVPISSILVTLKKEAICSSETLVKWPMSEAENFSALSGLEKCVSVCVLLVMS
jgi:hypothetical protein